LVKTIVRRSALAKAKEAAEIKAIERKAKLEAYGDYIGFTVTKLFGIIALITGVIKLVVPSLLTIDLPHPESALGVGFALLAGNKVVRLIAKALNSIKP
jgi:hypothetical protein